MSTIGNIKSLRERSGISQEIAAKHIGVSRPSYEKIESGDKDLTIPQAQKLAELLGVGFTDLFGDTFEKTTLRYDEKKYKEMIRRFINYAGSESDGRIPKTKLAKLLYLADFAWFYDNLESMSGLEYRRIPQGPVPDEYFRVIDDMFGKGEVDIKFSGRAMMIKLNDEIDKDDPALSKDEDKLINNIANEWKTARTETIVDFTHRQNPWRLCYESEMIPYELIIQEDPDHVYKRPRAVSRTA